MAYRKGKQPMANPNKGITTAAQHTMGQRINAEHRRQKPNPFGIAYEPSYGALAMDYSGCGGGNCTKKSDSGSITKQDIILLLLAFGLGYLLVKR